MNEFTEKEEEIRAMVEEKLGDGYTVTLISANKNNECLHGVNICNGKASTTPVIYFTPGDDRTVEEQADKIIEVFQNARTQDDFSAVPSLMKSFATAKSHIVMRLVGTKDNEAYLADKPSRPWNDLAIIYACNVGNNGSIVITNEIASGWRVTDADLDEAARENMPKLLPVAADPMGAVISDILGTEGSLGDAATDIRMMIVTNESKLFGAAAMATDEGLQAIKRFADEAGKNYYILPSSVHEIIALRDDGESGSPDALRQMIREINDTQVAPDERLSNTLYYYDRENNEISICG
jgi:hypothetical protein